MYKKHSRRKVLKNSKTITKRNNSRRIKKKGGGLDKMLILKSIDVLQNFINILRQCKPIIGSRIKQVNITDEQITNFNTIFSLVKNKLEEDLEEKKNELQKINNGLQNTNNGLQNKINLEKDSEEKKNELQETNNELQKDSEEKKNATYKKIKYNENRDGFPCYIYTSTDDIVTPDEFDLISDSGKKIFDNLKELYPIVNKDISERCY